MEKIDLLEAKIIIMSLFDENIVGEDNWIEDVLATCLVYGDKIGLFLSINTLLTCNDRVPKWLSDFWSKYTMPYSPVPDEAISFSILSEEIKDNIQKLFIEDYHTKPSENCTQVEHRTSCLLCDKGSGFKNCDNEFIDVICSRKDFKEFFRPEFWLNIHEKSISIGKGTTGTVVKCDLCNSKWNLHKIEISCDHILSDYENNPDYEKLKKDLDEWMESDGDNWYKCPFNCPSLRI